MAFTRVQVRQLKAKLDPQHIRTRQAGRATLNYVEGWHVIAEANRIFGFEGWDRETVSTSCVSTNKNRSEYAVAYIARVRITVRAGEITVVREGCGTGEAKAFSPGQAHDLALKSAETDATKRALTSFGNIFGLALYDREQSGVKNGRSAKFNPAEAPQAGPWALRSIEGEVKSVFDAPEEFADALRDALQKAANVDDLFGLWRQNVDTVRSLHRLYRGHSGSGGIDGISLVAHLKACARRLGDTIKIPESENTESKHSVPSSPRLPARIDKSMLTISEPKRIRSKEHLRFVAQQPCLICGRNPSHAHHVRFAQPRGLALKVSDEFTVPLCAIHHSENHSTGDERRWWQEHKIDPLVVAAQLWTSDVEGGSAPRL